MPQQTFSSSQKLQANGETLMLQYFKPAHTDTDIYIHFQKANVIHMGRCSSPSAAGGDGFN